MEVPFRLLITKLLLLTTTVGFSSFNNVIEYNQNVIDSSKTLKVLMIGNSFTFYWNLPQVIECMLNAQNTSFEVDQKTIRNLMQGCKMDKWKSQVYSFQKRSDPPKQNHSQAQVYLQASCNSPRRWPIQAQLIPSLYPQNVGGER